MTRTMIPVLAVLALAAAGCGGSKSAATTGATATASGQVNTAPASTSASGSASFDVNLKQVQRQLAQGLRSVEKGNLLSAATVLANCTDTVTTQLGAHAKTAKQQQAVSQLRTACGDVASAVAKLKSGDRSAAKQLAQTALQEVQQAGGSAK